MRRFLFALMTITASLWLAAGMAQAYAVFTGSGNATCELNAEVFENTDCSLVTIQPHELWQQPNDGHLAGSSAVWVSYADTGVDGTTLAPTPQNPGDLAQTPWIMKVTEQFSVDANGANFLLQIWADDTAEVRLDNVVLTAANFTQDHCAAEILGCEPDEFFSINTVLNQGLHTLEIFIYQLGSGNTPMLNPFGLLYSGEVNGALPYDATIPSLTCMFFMGLIGIYGRRLAMVIGR